MNVDIIKAIHEAEEKADGMIVKAHNDAKKIILNAKEDAIRQREDRIKGAREKANQMKQAAKDDVKDTLLSMETQFEEEKRSIEQAADSHLKKAVDMLVDKVVG